MDALVMFVVLAPESGVIEEPVLMRLRLRKHPAQPCSVVNPAAAVLSGAERGVFVTPRVSVYHRNERQK